ncbi:MAG: hypothetical protein K1X83_13380 [Oligoflexia bacterium]|nr:hypothetical protein [Oligoflexia bacterium]
MKHRSKLFVSLLLTQLALQSCTSGGGGGGGDASPDVGGSTVWHARAAVSHDGCGERIAEVRQTFRVISGAGGVSVDTSMITVPATDNGGTIEFGFDESNGDCSRSYAGSILPVSDTEAEVNLSAISNCNGVVCENNWIGTATKGGN